jgi:hypothetical protein
VGQCLTIVAVGGAGFRQHFKQKIKIVFQTANLYFQGGMVTSPLFRTGLQNRLTS